MPRPRVPTWPHALAAVLQLDSVNGCRGSREVTDQMWMHIARVAIVAAATGTLFTACRGPADTAPAYNRSESRPWTTEQIQEDGDTLRITVRTADSRDAERIAHRIVEQRKAQSWQVVQVTVIGARDEDRQTITWHHGEATGRARGR